MGTLQNGTRKDQKKAVGDYAADTRQGAMGPIACTSALSAAEGPHGSLAYTKRGLSADGTGFRRDQRRRWAA